MEVHQMLFEKAGSRPEELLVSDSGMIPTLCNAESSAPLASAFLPLGELATRQFTQLDCEPVQQASSTAAELNGGHQQQQKTTANTQLATIVAPTGAQLQSTANDAFAFAKPTKLSSHSKVLNAPISGSQERRLDTRTGSDVTYFEELLRIRA
uniref:Uncharacterized protein n=1 Tax=Parascaris univalens TaxID=6257 RepID=A0A915BZG4_PARUN